MNASLDYDLTTRQWDALRALRAAESGQAGIDRWAVEALVALDLATASHGRPVITAKGRHVLLRGSPKLWDVAA